MHQTKKGNEWHCGMKLHIGVDADSGLVHSMRATAANVADVTAAGSGFGTETNEVTIFHRDGEAERLPLLSKYAVAHAILDRVTALLP